MCGTCGCGSETKFLLISKETASVAFNEAGLHNHYNHAHPHDHLHHEHVHHHHHPHPHHHDHIHIDLEKDVLHKNQLYAERNRGYFMAKNIMSFNLISSPGSGKTTILEKTLTAIGADIPCYVIEGDQQTTHDANRIDATGTPVIQINTGKGCHLESDHILQAIEKLEPQNDAFLFIENVGNLVCPSMFDLGENFRVVIMSVTEGDDKPIKYPDAFHEAQVCLINKMDLLPYVDFDVKKAKDYALRVNPKLQFFEVSATTGDGMDQWYNWIKEQKK